MTCLSTGAGLLLESGIAMDNEPEKPQSSTPPPPDIPPPSPASPLPMPNLAPPPPAPAPPMPDVPPPPPPAASADPYTPPKQSEAKFDSDQDEGAVATTGEAKFDTRLIAALIDAIVGTVIYMVLGKLSFMLGWLVSSSYYLLRDALPFLDGQSVGKKLMKTRAVDLNGKPLTGNWQASIVRNIGLFIPFFGLVEAYILYSKKNENAPLRRLGDDWAKTKVVVVPDQPAA